MRIVYLAKTQHTFLSLLQVVQPEVYIQHFICKTDEEFVELNRNLIHSEFGFDKNFFPGPCLRISLFNKLASGKGLNKRLYVFDTEDFTTLQNNLPTHYLNRHKWEHTFTVEVVDNNESFVIGLCEWNHGQMPYIPYTEEEIVDVEFDELGIKHLFWKMVDEYHNNDLEEFNGNLRRELKFEFDDAEKLIGLYNLRPLGISYKDNESLIHSFFAAYTKRCGDCIEFRIDGNTIKMKEN